MFISKPLIGTLASAVAVQAAHERSGQDKYHGVGLALVFSPWEEPLAFSPAPVEMNRLVDLGNTSCNRIFIQTSVHPNVDVTRVECRAFKDRVGQIPGSAPFNHKRQAELSTGLVQIGSVLCYTVTEDEFAIF